MGDSPVHIGSDLNLDGAVRNMVASAFGVAADLPGVITAGCGLQVARGDTARTPEGVSCPACRRYAHHKLLEYADHIEQLGPLPGTGMTLGAVRLAARTARETAGRFADPDDQGPVRS